ncbi:MAG: DEAD/DEAH box helicase [Dehalococcoidia bacterium]|nr:DEAD/DEAH box helicase [Dehalococcoidia bacterium]
MVDDEDLATVTFEALGVPHDLVEVLNDRGITAPFPIQVLTIPEALAGRDVSGKAKTGSGKTLAFGLPLVERTKTAKRRRPASIVLVPTRELANQVADEIAPLAKARGLWITAIYGGVSMSRQINALHHGVDVVIATPGRLNDLLERGEMSVADVQFVVIDEADQMADMGFLPQVERILKQIEGTPQTLLFSATLDGAVGALVRNYQRDPVRHEVESETMTVDSLEQRFIGVTSEDRLPVAARICAGAARALVFVRTTHGADRVAKQLADEGLRTAAIHGRLSQAKREAALAAFSAGRTPVLVATNVAARGLHVSGIDVVIHFDIPDDHKTYLHRSGRTARAGEDGLVVTLVLPEQMRDIAMIQRDAGLDLAIVPMRPDDNRLLDLAAWEAPAGLVWPTRGSVQQSGPGPRGRNQRSSAPPRNAPGRPAGRGGVRAASHGDHEGARPASRGASDGRQAVVFARRRPF